MYIKLDIHANVHISAEYTTTVAGWSRSIHVYLLRYDIMSPARAHFAHFFYIIIRSRIDNHSETYRLDWKKIHMYVFRTFTGTHCSVLAYAFHMRWQAPEKFFFLIEAAEKLVVGLCTTHDLWCTTLRVRWLINFQKESSIT